MRRPIEGHAVAMAKADEEMTCPRCAKTVKEGEPMFEIATDSGELVSAGYCSAKCAERDLES